MLFLVLVALVMGCEKDVVDARDEFVGVYTCRVVTIGEDADGEYNFVDEGITLEVSKGPGAQLLFDFEGLQLVGGLDATENDGIVINDDLVDVQGDVYRMDGTGFFGNNTISLTLGAEAVNFFDVSVLSITGNKP